MHLKQRTQKLKTDGLWQRFHQHPTTTLGTLGLAGLIILSLFAPYVSPHNPEYIDINNSNQGMSFNHPLGTDDLGRDNLARNLYGGRISLAVGFVAMLASITLGTVIGLLAGYYPRLDEPLMRLTDIMLSLPPIPILLVVIMLFRDTMQSWWGATLGIFILIVSVIGLLGWMPTARLVRASVLTVKGQLFIESAITIGCSQMRILSHHIFPNVLSPIIVAATLDIAAAILAESALSFLGLGFPTNVPSWGRLLFDNKNFLDYNPIVVIWPGLFISLTILSINAISDGIQDLYTGY